MNGLTLIETRQIDHFALGMGLLPACGSHAQVQGYHYSADGEVRTSRRVCAKCLEIIGAEVEAK